MSVDAESEFAKGREPISKPVEAVAIPEAVRAEVARLAVASLANLQRLTVTSGREHGRITGVNLAREQPVASESPVIEGSENDIDIAGPIIKSGLSDFIPLVTTHTHPPGPRVDAFSPVDQRTWGGILRLIETLPLRNQRSLAPNSQRPVFMVLFTWSARPEENSVQVLHQSGPEVDLKLLKADPAGRQSALRITKELAQGKRLNSELAALKESAETLERRLEKAGFVIARFGFSNFEKLETYLKKCLPDQLDLVASPPLPPPANFDFLKGPR